MLKRILWVLLQATWCLPQNLTGFCIWLALRPAKSRFFHGAVVTPWKASGCTSLGCFIFMQEDAADNVPLLVHEFGHSLQSAVLGWLYYLVIYLPSVVWFQLPSLRRYRREHQISYYTFYTEAWANHWGEKFTGEKSIGKIMID